MFTALIGWLLDRANAQPPWGHHPAFYRMKKSVLQRFGSLLGTEWQHIRKVCYACGGDGEADDQGPCHRCGGSGNYLEKFVLLQRWKLGAYAFHQPVHQQEVAPHEPIAITGYIRHTGYGADSTEAALWLALLFDWGLLFDLFHCGYGMPWSWGRPFSVLYHGRHAIRQTRLWIRRQIESLTPRRCRRCGHRFLPLFRSSWAWCAACAYVLAQEQEAQDLPF
jgi:hypothetical protein